MRRMNLRERRQAREKLRKRDGDLCQICGEPLIFGEPMSQHHPELSTIDHIVAISRGGSNHISNLRLVHRRCNLARRDGINLEVAPLDWQGRPMTKIFEGRFPCRFVARRSGGFAGISFATPGEILVRYHQLEKRHDWLARLKKEQTL